MAVVVGARGTSRSPPVERVGSPPVERVGGPPVGRVGGGRMGPPVGKVLHTDEKKPSDRKFRFQNYTSLSYGHPTSIRSLDRSSALTRKLVNQKVEMKEVVTRKHI
jgi:hypothetical protein